MPPNIKNITERCRQVHNTDPSHGIFVTASWGLGSEECSEDWERITGTISTSVFVLATAADGPN